METKVRDAAPTATPFAKVMVLFRQDVPHDEATRRKMAGDLTLAVGNNVERSRGKVHVEYQYGKSDMEVFMQAFEDRVKAAQEEVEELDRVLKNMSPQNDMAPLAIRRDQKHAELRVYSYLRLILPK